MCTDVYTEETFVLEALLSEVDTSDLQYGGIKGTGVNHFLVKMWDEILRGLENGKSAVNLTAIDFSKAFNRLDHNACLRALARRGASNQTLRMVYLFLENRTMLVRHGEMESKERSVHGGSPQGTKLGNVLFCLTVEGIHEEWPGITYEPESQIQLPQSVPVSVPLSPMAAIPDRHRRQNMTSTPCLNDTININFRSKRHGMFNKMNCIRDDIFDESLGLDAEERNEWAIMYIDDLSVGEVLDLGIATSTYTQKKEQKKIHARRSETYFRRITENAESIGMKINSDKTQLLCISDCNFSEVSSFIYTDSSTRVCSNDTMKILGFVFNSKPNANAHVLHIINKFNKAVWALTHLRRAGISNNVLTKVYSVMLRPIIEFCSPIYHALITQDQSAKLERLQKTALQIIFGFSDSYSKNLEKSGLQSLEERRICAFKAFTLSVVKNERYESWFPRLDQSTMNLRERKTFVEQFARTERLYNSPLYRMRRLMNIRSDWGGGFYSVLCDWYCIKRNMEETDCRIRRWRK